MAQPKRCRTEQQCVACGKWLRQGDWMVVVTLVDYSLGVMHPRCRERRVRERRKATG